MCSVQWCMSHMFPIGRLYMTLEDMNLTNQTWTSFSASNWIVLNNVSTPYTTNVSASTANISASVANVYAYSSGYAGPFTSVVTNDSSYNYFGAPMWIQDSFCSTNLVGDNGGAGSGSAPSSAIMTNSCVGHELAIRFRNGTGANGTGDSTLFVANVVLSVIAPPTLNAPNKPNITTYSFTINSWPSNSYYVLVATNIEPIQVGSKCDHHQQCWGLQLH